jgi:Leucine-rich repeat (LRR) protein
MRQIAFTLMANLLVASPLFCQNVDIPDANFLNALIEDGIDTNEDGQISYAEAAVVTKLDISQEKISDMSGIESFVNLDSLYCWNNKLVNLDVSYNTALTYLDCGRNELLSSLDVSECIALEELVCYGNFLTHLDLSNNPALVSLQCGHTKGDTGWGNQLTKLDISNNFAIGTGEDIYGAELNLSVMPSLHKVCVTPWPPLETGW